MTSSPQPPVSVVRENARRADAFAPAWPFAKLALWYVASVSLTLLVWQSCIWIFHPAPYIVPTPRATYDVVVSQWSQIWPLALGTFRETIYGYAAGAALGFLLAVAMYKIRVFRSLSYPLIIGSQAIPIIALAPILVLVIGFNIYPTIIVVTWIVFFPVTINTLDGFLNLDPDLLNLTRVLGATRGRRFWFVELPGVVTPLFSGLKIGAAYAVTGAIIGEQAASSGPSLYQFQVAANNQSRTDLVYGITIVMMIIGLLWFAVVTGLDRIFTPWKYRATARRWFRRDRTRNASLTTND